MQNVNEDYKIATINQKVIKYRNKSMINFNNKYKYDMKNINSISKFSSKRKLRSLSKWKKKIDDNHNYNNNINNINIKRINYSSENKKRK
jgi:hypothetical protein